MFEQPLGVSLPIIGEVPPEGLPYALIGEIVVSIILLVVGAALLLLAGGICVFIWVRGFTFISDSMYIGHDANPENRPPLWKLRIAAVTAALSRFKFTKIPAAYRECDDLAENDETFLQFLQRTIIE